MGRVSVGLRFIGLGFDGLGRACVTIFWGLEFMVFRS